MHVHLYVESPETGVAVIDQLVPWLPVILAISANSPFYQGRDTAYASWRSQAWAQWPSAGPTERFGSLETYREVSRQMRESGAAQDEGMLYFDARLSADHPTVEVRISDVCTGPRRRRAHRGAAPRPGVLRRPAVHGGPGQVGGTYGRGHLGGVRVAL